MPTLLDVAIIESLESYIPIIVLPRLSGPHRRPNTPHIDKKKFKLSSFKPTSAVALRTGLFHSPETAGLLRAEAADRFLRWREVERAVGEIKSSGKRKRDSEQESRTEVWSKAKWEMEWMEDHSLHVARRMRDVTITQKVTTNDQSRSKETFQPSSLISFDPLHLPSLFFFSLSLFEPLKSKMKQCVTGFFGDWNWMQTAIIGGVGFCVGLGVGLFSQ